jgi:hypothetical protein
MSWKPVPPEDGQTRRFTKSGFCFHFNNLYAAILFPFDRNWTTAKFRLITFMKNISTWGFDIYSAGQEIM